MNRYVFAAGIVALVAVSVVLAQELAVEGRRDLYSRSIVTKSGAFVLMPSELVCGPEVVKLHWSPRERYILVEHIESTGDGPDKRRLSVYDRRARRLDPVWRFAAERSAVSSVDWLGTTDTALVTVAETSQPGGGESRDAGVTTHRLLRVIAPSAVARPVPGVQSVSRIWVNASPKQPFAIVTLVFAPKAGPPGSGAAPRERAQVRFGVRANGTVGPPLEDTPGRPYGEVWTPDGWLVRRQMAKDAEGRYRPTAAWVFDIDTGRTVPVEDPQRLAVLESIDAGPNWGTNPRLAWPITTLSHQGASHRARSLWLETTDQSDRPRALISPDAKWCALSSKEDSALYTEKRSAWIAPIVRLSLDAYRDLTLQAVMSDAKQIGTALQMYVQDYDEKFPLPEHVSGGAVSPYLQDSEAAGGFNYLYPGESIRSVKKPGETTMGFLFGPGGRAVVYVDGRVKWEPASK